MKNVKSFLLILVLAASLNGCVSMAMSAEEYFSLGMAFFDLGRFEDAERWLNRARQADRTMTASQYNLGRIAFELGRYQEAAEHFEGILRRDPNNTFALRAAAFTRIRTGEIEIAEKHYSKLLELVPDSLDLGYNHALVLFAMGHYERAEEILLRHQFALHDDSDMLLLYARTQRALDNIEAIDSFERWLRDNTDIQISYEFAGLLEQHGFYARALEEYRLLLEDTTPQSEPRQSDVRFALARVLLIADSESIEGVTELEAAIADGFNDMEAIEELIDSGRVSTANASSLRFILETLQREARQEQPDDDDDEEENEDLSEHYPEVYP